MVPEHSCRAGAFPPTSWFFWSKPVGVHKWEEKDEAVTLADDTSLSGQFAQHWKLRIMAQEAALKEIADGRLRRALAFNESFSRADVKIGDTVLC